MKSLGVYLCHIVIGMVLSKKLSPEQEVVLANFNEYNKATYPDKDESSAFELFVASLVLKQVNPTESELISGITDGPCDGGIDAMYLVLNGNSVINDGIMPSLVKNLPKRSILDLYVIQSKKSYKWDATVFQKMGSSLKLILSSTVNKKKLQNFPLNTRTVNLTMKLKRTRKQMMSLVPKINVHCIYASLASDANGVQQLRTVSTQLAESIKEQLPIDADIKAEYWGSEELYKVIGSETDFESMLTTQKTILRDGDSFTALVTINDYLSFIRLPGNEIVNESMFTVNVRDYAGTGVRVNNAILNTLKNNSKARFWWLNNGITILADDFNDQSEFDWVITNPLVVNGLQTSYTINQAASEKLITNRRLKEPLLVRVIKNKLNSVREDIITGTNNQTVVNDIQLHANDDLQEHIERYLKVHGWYYERRKYQYRSQSGIPKSKIRTVTELSQAIIAYWLLLPDQARARPRSFLTHHWNQVFNPEYSSETLELYLKAITVQQKVDDFLQSKQAKEISVDFMNNRFYLTACYSLQSSGAKSISEFNQRPVKALCDNPNDDDLTEIYKIITNTVSDFPEEKLVNDKLYKNSEFTKAVFLACVPDLKE